MKALKIVAFVVGGVVVLVALLLVLALTPSVQTWAVRKAVAGQPGVTLELDRVAAGLSAADVTNLRYAKDGMVVTAKGVSAQYSAWDYITKGRINADQVTIQELLVDLRNMKRAGSAPGGSGGATPAGTPATASSAPGDSRAPTPGPAPQRTAGPAEKKPPFEGLLKQAQLPFDVRIGNLTAKGRALLPDEQVVTFDLQGSGIETGQRGKLQWTIDFADSKQDADLRALRSTGTAGVQIAADRRIDLVEIDAIAAAMGPRLPPDRVQLVAKADQPTAGGNEGYSATVSLLRGNNAETIFKTSAQFHATSREIAGAWEVRIRTEQLAALLAGLGLPELAADGSGKFALKPDADTVSASGDLQGQASQLTKLSPALEAVGAVNFKTTFDGGMAGETARLEKLDLEVTGLDGRKFAQISSLQKVTYGLTDKRVTLADPKAGVARISLQQLPLAWAQPVARPMVIESGDLSLVLAVEAEADGSRIRAHATEPLALRTVTIRDADKKLLAEKVSLSVRPTIDYSAAKITAQLAELNVSMPGGDALSGRLTADITHFAETPVIAFSTQLQGKIVNLLKPHLPLDPGPLAIEMAVEGRHEGDRLDVAKASATVNREGGALLSSLELQQPIRADLKANTFAAANPNATAARVRLGEIPLAWAEAFVEKSKFAGTLTGATIDVSMRSMEDLTITTAQPVALTGVSATLDGKPMVQALDMVAELTATKRGDAVSYDVRRIEVKQGQTALASLNVAGEANLGTTTTLSAKGKFDANAAALMKQPVAAPFATLSRGTVAAVFEASIAEATQAKAAISARNLVATQDNRALGDLEMSLTANVKPDGSGTLSLPLTLTNGGRKSDLTINGAFGKSANQQSFLFTGKIAGNQVVVDDFEPLAALAPAGEKKAPPTAPATRDTEPFWKGVNGKVDVDLKRVLYGKDYVISGVRGAAVITDSKLSLDGLEGRFKENPFKLAAGVTFAAQQPKPYALTGSANVTDLAIGEILRAANPNEKPAMESKVTVVANLNGNGATIADLAKNIYGRFDLTGTQGVLRALGRKTEAASTASALLGLAGAITGSQQTMAIAEVTAALAELRFDTFRMQVERGADLGIKLSSVEFISPYMRTVGSGAIANRPNTPVENQPMEIQLQFGAKDQLAQLLAKVGALGDKQDDKGYRLLQRTFTLGGTPANPNSSALWSFLLEQTMSRGVPALEGLLRGRRE